MGALGLDKLLIEFILFANKCELPAIHRMYCILVKIYMRVRWRDRCVE